MRVLRWASRLWTGVLCIIALGCGLLFGLRFLLPLLPLEPRPALSAASPAPGAVAVAPRSQITLHFSTPMNPRSVERTLRLSPAVPLAYTWSADNTTLVLSPTLGLQADIGYVLHIDAGAQSRFFRPLETPFQLAFHTVAAPIVLAMYPDRNARNVPVTAPISVSFSHPFVPTDTLALPLDVPLLRLDPPLTGTTTWIDQATALFRPDQPLQPGTRYRATLGAGLTDALGGRLDRDITWTFSTTAPALLTTTPPDNAEQVAPRSPLALHVNQPLDLTQVQAALTISPTVAGSVAAQLLPDASQVITFTPESGWRPNTRYTAELAAGLRPVGGNMPLERLRWSFRTAPQPALAGRFPGEGQVLPIGQAVRLIFTTSVDPAALERGLTITPPVEDLRVTSAGNEARISAQFAATTVYTLTLAAAIVDENAIALDRDYQLHVVGAPAMPTLRLPDMRAHTLVIVPEATLRMQRVNLPSLGAVIYPLDEDSVVRLLAFSESAWRDFNPERAGLNATRAWTLAFTDTLNQPVDAPLALTADGAALPEGVYYLRLRAPERQSVDALVFASATHLTLGQHHDHALIWATNTAGAPLEGVPLALYRDGALLARGTSGTGGIWLPDAAIPVGAPLLALSNTGALAQSGPKASDAGPTLSASLLTDRSAYQSGDSINLAGFVHANAPGTLTTAGLRGTLSLRSRTSSDRLAVAPMQLRAGGVISEALALPGSLVAGDYLLTAALGSQLFTTNIRVLDAHSLPPTLALALPPTLAAGEPLTLMLVATLNGLPYANAPVTWTLHVEPSSVPDVAATDTSVPPASGYALAGTARTDANGRLVHVISDTLSITQPLQLQVQTAVAAPDGSIASAQATVRGLPAQRVLNMQIDQRIIAAGAPLTVSLRLAGAAGPPLAGQRVQIELLRLPAANRISARSVQTDAAGRVLLVLDAPTAGAYQLHATAVDQRQRLSTATTALWVRGDGFVWPTSDGALLPLIADKVSYQPGETAQLLVAGPFEPGAALVVVQRQAGLEGTVQLLQSGGVLTVTIQPDDPPLLHVEVVVAARGSGNTPQIAPVDLAVAHAPGLHVALASDAATYAPRSTATLTVTTTDARGQARPAAVVLRLGADADQSRPAPFAPDDVLAWRSNLRTNASGVLTVTLPLPDRAVRLLAHIWVADEAGASGMAQQTLAVTQPLEIAFDAPPRLRVGDRVALQARIRNTSAVPQRVQSSVELPGLRRESADPSATFVLAAGAEQRLTWAAQVEHGPVARLRFSAQADGFPAQTLSQIRPVLPAGVSSWGGALARGQWSIDLKSALDVEIVPSTAALWQTSIALIAPRDRATPVDAAALLQLAAPITAMRVLANEALQALVVAQRFDGGWGWTVGAASDPDVTVAALEGLALARRAGLVVADSVVQRGLMALSNATPGAVLEARARYAAALFGPADAARIAALAAAPESLDASGIALLLLARKPDSARDRALVEALLGRVIRDSAGARVAGSGPGGDISATALATLALAQAHPGAPLLNELARWLAAHRALGEASDSLAMARVTAALAAVLPATTPQAYAAAFAGAPLVQAVAGSVTLGEWQFNRPNSPAGITGTLSITATGGFLLVAYRNVDSSAGGRSLGILRELLDADGRPLGPGALRLGAFVRVRLTVLARQPLRFVTLAEPLASGWVVVNMGRGDFVAAARRDTLLLARPSLDAQVYEYNYIVQLVAPGHFTIPAPVATTSDGVAAGQGLATQIDVQQ